MAQVKNPSIFLLASLIPIIPLMHLYSKNAEDIFLSHALIVGLVMTAVSALLYGIILLLYKTPLCALLGVAIWWILFFLYGYVYDAGQIGGLRYRHLFFVAFLLYGVIILFLGILKSYLLNPVLELGVCVFIGVLLLFNLLVTVSAIFKTVNTDILYDGFKDDFAIDQTLPSPNVYWLHCDGMLGFSSMEKYFGDPQADFASSLESKGFVINKDAHFGDHYTTGLAIPALMCPDYYDTYLVNGLRPNLIGARLNNELIQAFEAKGYHTATIAHSDQYYFPTVSRFYDTWYPDSDNMLVMREEGKTKGEILDAMNATIKANNLHSLLKHSLILPFQYEITMRIYSRNTIGERAYIPKHTIGSDVTDNIPMFWGLVDSISESSPKLTIVHDLTAHSPFYYDENGNPHGNDPFALQSYYAQHKFAAKRLEKMIDYVLQIDQNAVIVLQADHGLQLQSREDIADAFGEDAAPDIWNSVMSAIRIPAQYGDLKEPVHPLNISRYLANKYVGENYDYILP